MFTKPTSLVFFVLLVTTVAFVLLGLSPFRQPPIVSPPPECKNNIVGCGGPTHTPTGKPVIMPPYTTDVPTPTYDYNMPTDLPDTPTAMPTATAQPTEIPYPPAPPTVPPYPYP